MKIKSLEDLHRIREESKSKVKFREHGKHDDGKIEILVGMATCGISSGARETLNALMDEIEREHLDNVRVIPVGCIGYCHSEPVVQVNVPGQKPVLYGKVDEKIARIIIQKHIKKGEILKGSVLDINFERA